MTKKKSTVSYSLNELEKMRGRTDWKKVDALADKDIDYSDIPELGADFWRNLKILKPVGKTAAGLRLDDDVLAWYKKTIGKGYQSHINAVLRAYMFSSGRPT